jgi:hypothetical protein
MISLYFSLTAFFSCSLRKKKKYKIEKFSILQIFENPLIYIQKSATFIQKNKQIIIKKKNL